MPVVDSTAFLARYPEFSAVPVAAIDLRLADAEQDTDANLFGQLHARAISALAAHNLALSHDEDGNAAQGSAPAMTQTETVDRVSATYVTPNGIGPQVAAYHATRYGVEYLGLLARVASGPIVVG